MFLAIRGIKRASVPDAQVIHSATPTYSDSFFSRSKTFFPSIKSPLFKIDSIS